MISHILLDIEGTTCPVSFVTETLFPYAKLELKSFLDRHKKDPLTNQLIDNADNEWIQDKSEDSTRLRHQSEKGQQTKHLKIEAYLQLLIETDKKSTTLKDIQGKIWKEGYTTGRISSELFEDAHENLKRWHKQGYKLSVYSSGSVEAQHLLYKYTNKGDIKNLFSYWFDTHIGNKKEPSSYTEIASVMDCKPQNILFISDNSDECDAARSAGLGTLYSMRDGNPQQEPRNHPVIRHLEEVEKWLNPKL
ncbi:acireductone synthase [Synechococcus sp. AH-601-P06]|nr:acireductone synthase [Synechococcus sp. AH-601-P06]